MLEYRHLSTKYIKKLCIAATVSKNKKIKKSKKLLAKVRV
jgi:hypothetical protein